MARPLLDVRPLGFDGPLLLVVDDDWAAAKSWRERMALTASLLAQADRDGRLVVVLVTAPRSDGAPIAASAPMVAGAARSIVNGLAPHPWARDLNAATTALDALTVKGPMRAGGWAATGLADRTSAPFAQRLARLGALEVAAPDPAALPHAPLPPDAASVELAPVAWRADGGPAEQLALRAVDAEGHTLQQGTLDFAAGANRTTTAMAMPASCATGRRGSTSRMRRPQARWSCSMPVGSAVRSGW